MNMYGRQSGLITTNAKSIKENRTVKQNKFRRWLRNWLLNSENDSEVQPTCYPVEPVNLQSDGMRFQLYKANGGYVIETTRIDRMKDRAFHQIYIITNDADIGAEIGKIITMEQLRS